MFLKIPPTSTGFFKPLWPSVFSTTVYIASEIHIPSTSRSGKITTKPLAIYVSRSWPILYTIPPPHPATKKKNRNLYEVIWHNSFDTPEFSHLLTTHNTIHVTEIQFSVLQSRSVLLFLPVYFSSSQWLTARLTSFLRSSSYQTASKGPILRAASKGKFSPLDHTKWFPPRKGTDPLSHNFTVYCSLSPSGPHLD